MPFAPSGAAGRLVARLAAIALTFVGLALAAAAFAAPAVAHTQLAGSDPAAGAVLDESPGEVVLEFGGELLDLGAIILVVDEDGTDWTAGAVVIERSTARVALRPALPDGRYEVRWQVVADDGHPVSGVIPFGIGEAPTPTSAAPTAPAATGPGAEETGAQEPSPDLTEIVRLALVGLGGAAVGVLVLLGVLRIRRRPRLDHTEADSATDHTHS